MKKISAIVTAAFCSVWAVLALSGCDALGLRVTERGIEGNSNTLLICTIVIIVALVFIQRFFSK